jgi:hypothetical protein
MLYNLLSELPALGRYDRSLQSQPSQRLLELDARLKRYVVGRVSDQNLELSRLRLPVLSAVVPEFERVLVQLDGDGLFLPGLEGDLLERLKLLDRSTEAALDVSNVDLSDLLPGNLARVLDLERDFKVTLGRD